MVTVRLFGMTKMLAGNQGVLSLDLVNGGRVKDLVGQFPVPGARARADPRPSTGGEDGQRHLLRVPLGDGGLGSSSHNLRYVQSG